MVFRASRGEVLAAYGIIIKRGRGVEREPATGPASD